MPYTTSVAGTTITASWANTNLRDQVITPFSGTTARDAAITSPIEGMFSYQSDTDRVTTYNGSAWVDALQLGTWFSYTPTLTQSATVTKTVTYAKYARFGRTILLNVRLDVTGAGTAANAIQVGLPATAVSTGEYIGIIQIYDASAGAGTPYIGMAGLQTTSTVIGLRDSSAGAAAIGASPNFALANGDQIMMSLHYEAAAST